MRSQLTIDLRALRHNTRRLLEAAGEAELWAVVKADGYGHGALDCGEAALDAGASALCVATVAEGLALRRALPAARIVVMGPSATDELGDARDASLELVVADGEIPDGVRVHLKLDTGMGRWGLSELQRPGRDVVGLMTHFATADDDLAFARVQLERFLAATEQFAHLTRHAANSAAVLAFPESALDAVRCGIALYGLSPFGHDPGEDGLEPVLSWVSELAQVKRLSSGESTGYGRRFVAESASWIGIVPVGYADGFRRDFTGTSLLVEGIARPVVGTVSMDAVAVLLDAELPAGTRVTIVGDGLPIVEHARQAGTIAYEVVCGIRSGPLRARRVVVDG